MKNGILILLCLSLLALSCRKEGVSNCINQTDKVSLEGAITLKEGVFIFTSSKFFGSGKMYQQKNGRYVVGLEQMNITDNTDMQVYLSKTPTLSETSVKLFSARDINGNKYYLLPANFIIADFDYILIMDDRQENAIGTAALN